MNTHEVRILVVKDTESKQEVYGQIIHDEYLSASVGTPGSTQAAVRAYLDEFCSDCYIRNNKVDAIDDAFSGIAAVVAEEAGKKEYNVVVKKLIRPMDNREILEYHNKEFREWNAAREINRGNPDPRLLQGPIRNNTKSEMFWETFWFAFKLISLAILLVFVFHSITSNDSGSNEH